MEYYVMPITELHKNYYKVMKIQLVSSALENILTYSLTFVVI